MVCSSFIDQTLFIDHAHLTLHSLSMLLLPKSLAKSNSTRQRGGVLRLLEGVQRKALKAVNLVVDRSWWRSCRNSLAQVARSHCSICSLYGFSKRQRLYFSAHFDCRGTFINATECLSGCTFAEVMSENSWTAIGQELLRSNAANLSSWAHKLASGHIRTVYTVQWCSLKSYIAMHQNQQSKWPLGW